MIDPDGILNNYTKYEENFIPDIKEGATEFLKNSESNLTYFCCVESFCYFFQLLIYYSQ